MSCVTGSTVSVSSMSGIYEIGLNAEAAHFTGVNVQRTKFWLFVLAGAVSAFAGVYFTLRFGTARGDNATGLELQVIAAVLLGGVSIFGGRGALHGVVAGVLLIGVLSSAMRLEGITVNITNIVIGLLLLASDVSTSVLNTGDYATIGNNQMLVANPVTREIRRFLTGPNGCEVTGVVTTPDRRTMFVNIQHPGEPAAERNDPANPKAVSSWPDGPQGARPRSATIAIRRTDGGVIGT